MLALGLTGLDEHAPLKLLISEPICEGYTRAHKRQLSCLYSRSAYSMLCDRVMEYSALRISCPTTALTPLTVYNLCYCYINIHPESIMILWIELTYILFEFRNQHVLNQIYIYAKVFTVRRSSFIFE